MPSCQTLASEYGVAVGTVHMAMRSLANDEVVTTVPGRGTFVSTHYAKSFPTSSAATLLRVAIVAGIGGEFALTGPNRGIWATISSIERSCGDLGGTSSLVRREVDGEDWEPFAVSLDRVDWENVEGAIVLAGGMDVSAAGNLVAAVRAARKPVVCLTSGALPGIVPHVFEDNRFGGYVAARHLIDKGHREFSFLEPMGACWADDRALGARDALIEAGITPNALTVVPPRETTPPINEAGRVTFDKMRDASRQIAAELLGSGSIPSAIIAANDAVAMGFIDIAKDCGFNHGIDYAIAGFDNSDYARDAQVTSMEPPWQTMAEEAVRLLSSTVLGKHTSTQVRVRPHLVPRASTSRDARDMSTKLGRLS